MTVYVTKHGQTITLMARAEDEEGIVGDLVLDVEPGGSALGKTYSEWDALGEGPVEI